MAPAVDSHKIRKTKTKIKAKPPRDTHSEASSSSSCSLSTSSLANSSPQKRGVRLFTRRRVHTVLSRPGTDNSRSIGALALHLGMSIAAAVSQVLERKSATDESISVDLETRIFVSAVQGFSLNVFGDDFDDFVMNFEKSFRSTLTTLRSISKSVKVGEDKVRKSSRRRILSDFTMGFNGPESLTSDSGIEHTRPELPSQAPFGNEEQKFANEGIEENTSYDTSNQQLTLLDTDIMHRLASVSSSRNSNGFQTTNDGTLVGTLEKSVFEQARSNDLKTFEMGLTMKKLQLKERQLYLNSDANFLERCKLSFGFKKASFKVEKFKNQVEETRHAELIRNCMDCLVAGLFIMLACLGYGVFIHSHKRISEATASCTPTESSSWWILKPMASFNTGMQILICKFQVLTRMLAGGIMVFVIAYLLLQRSSASNRAMPVTFILLLLGVACGFAGKLCIDTLGGSGNHWLFYWEILCCIHLFSNVWTSALFALLYGPFIESEKRLSHPRIPYMMRRSLFYATTFLFLPLLCGFLPFASLGEWKDHFCSLVMANPSSAEDFV